MAASKAPIFHLATPADWAVALESGLVAPPSLASEGFVHCSTEEQLASTIERHFSGAAELRVLRLAIDPLDPDVRWEESRPGEAYPHVYRAIAVDEVIEVIPWGRGSEDSA
jgi:glutathione S-transferase